MFNERWSSYVDAPLDDMTVFCDLKDLELKGRCRFGGAKEKVKDHGIKRRTFIFQ